MLTNTAKKVFDETLQIHIDVKTSDHVFHSFSESVYDFAFDVFHDVSEKQVDIDENSKLNEEMCKAKKYRLYDLLEGLKDAIKTEIESGNLTIGQDNDLRAKYDKAECLCGNARAFLEEEREENEKPLQKENRLSGISKKY